MPANKGATPDWHPAADFQQRYEVSHMNSEPMHRMGLLALVDWLDDTASIPDAEVYRHLNAATHTAVLLDAAERIHLNMRGDDYTASEATEMYLLREQGELGLYAVSVNDGGRRVSTSVDLRA